MSLRIVITGIETMWYINIETVWYMYLLIHLLLLWGEILGSLLQTSNLRYYSCCRWRTSMGRTG